MAFIRWSDSKAGKKAAEDAVESVPAEVELIPLLDLFRFSTPKELVLNFVGLVAACAAGSAMPFMTIMFGNITNDFVAFSNLWRRQRVLDALGEPTPPIDMHNNFKDSVSKNALWLTVIGVGLLCATSIYTYIWSYTGDTNAKRVRELHLQAVFRQGSSYVNSIGPGEITKRIHSDTHQYQQGISEKFAQCIFSFSSFLAGLAVAFAISWRLAFALLPVAPCFIIARIISNRVLYHHFHLSLKCNSERDRFAKETFSSVRSIHAFNGHSKVGHIFKAKGEALAQLEMKTAVWHSLSASAFFFIVYGAYALAFGFGTTLILSLRASAGDVVGVLMAVLIASRSLANLPTEMRTIIAARYSATVLFPVIDAIPPTTNTSSEEGIKPKYVLGWFCLDRVTFNYLNNPNPPVLRTLSLNFLAHRTTAIVGPPRSGKSTILSLIARLYDSQSGFIRLDDADIKTLNLKWLRKQIGFVSKESVLFSTTIQQNVGYGLIGTKWETFSEVEKFLLVEKACRQAGAEEFIKSLPLSYDTVIGEKSTSLSEGQERLIIIARAIVADPAILLLDEPAAGLDGESELQVESVLKNIAFNRTTIVIPHRISSVQDADLIYVMGDGQLVESGDHSDLILRKGPYYHLLQKHVARFSANEGLSWFPDEDPDIVPLVESPKSEKASELHDLPHRNETGKIIVKWILNRAWRELGTMDANAGVPPQERGLLYLVRRIASFTGGNQGKYASGIFLALLSGSVYPAVGVVYAKGLEILSLDDRREMRREGNRVALWFMLIAVLSTIIVLCQSYFLSAASSALAENLRTLSFNAITRQDIEYFDDKDNETTRLVHFKLNDDPQKIKNFAGVTLGVIVQSIFTVLIGSIIGVIVFWKLGLVAVACAPLQLVIGYLRWKVAVSKEKAIRKSHGESARFASEAAISSWTVSTLAREEDCVDIYRGMLEETFHSSNRTVILGTILYSLSQSMFLFVIALVFWFGSVLLARGEGSLFQFFVVLVSTAMSAVQTGETIGSVPDISAARKAACDIIKLFDSVPTIDPESTHGHIFPAELAQGEVSIKNVHFRYPTSPSVRVLRGVFMELESMAFVALVGAAGSGKSTLIQLIERFYDTRAGDVYYDGFPISELNVKEYRKQIGYVSRDTRLYPGTLEFNITLGADGEVTQDDLEEACAKADILDFIEGLSKGFKTEIDSKGVQLSRTHIQRIGIARAILRNPKVLLVDDATAGLDPYSAAVVQDAIEGASEGRTTIMATRYLPAMQTANRIYFFKEGKISEVGTHEQLITKRGDYYEYTRSDVLA